MKRVCVLIPWSIARDSRAQRTARTMARHAEVHVYHVPHAPGEAHHWIPEGAPIRLFPVRRRARALDRVLRPSLYFLDASFLGDAVRAGEGNLVYVHDLPAGWPGLGLARRHEAAIVYDVHDAALRPLVRIYRRLRPRAISESSPQ